MKSVVVVVVIVVALIGVLMYARMRPIEIEDESLETAVAVTLSPTAAATYPPGREPMMYPANYRENLVHYLTVDRGDAVTRNIYISPEAVEAALRGEMIPYGTITVIEAFDAGRDVLGRVQVDATGRLIPGELRVDEIHVGERRSTWLIEDTHANTYFDGWNFRAFDFNTGSPVDRDLNECFNCHDRAFRTEFMFTRNELYQFARTGQVQYFYCPFQGRVPC
jgi:hypothetical protein